MSSDRIKKTSEFCRKLADLSSTTSTQWVVVRDADKFSDGVGHDLDILTSSRAIDEIDGLVQRTAAATGWEVHEVTRKFEYTKILLRTDGETYLPIDIIGNCYYRGLSYIDERVAFQTIHAVDCGLPAPAIGFESAYIVMKDIITLGSVREHVRERVLLGLRQDEATFALSLEPRLGGSEAEHVIRLCLNHRWDELAGERKRLISALHPNRPRALLRRCAFLLTAIQHYASPGSGLFLAVIGPDGSGKTTLAKALSARLHGRPYTQHHHLAMNFAILPTLSSIRTGRAKSTQEPTKDAEYADPPTHTGQSWIITAWYSLDYLFGRLLIRRWKRLGHCTIFARYFYDYYFHGQHRTLPTWYLRGMELLVPAPDIVFFIDRDPADIYRCKPELTVREIQEQQSRAKDVIDRLPGGLVVDGTNGVEATVDQMVAAIDSAGLR